MSSGGLSDIVFKRVDEYVDSLAPQIQPRIVSELETFQQRTIDSLETQVIDAFRSLFNRDKPEDGSRGPWNLNDAAPDAYGGQSLPFADEIAKLTRSFSDISNEASGDLRDIFEITDGRSGSNQERSRDGDFSSGARGFLSSAINAVQEHMDKNQSPGSSGFELSGLLGVVSNTIKDVSQHPEDKARMISPEIKASIGDKLRVQHAPIAEQFTRIALDHIKRWLRGNTSARDFGDGAKAEIADQVGDLVKGLGGLLRGRKDDADHSARGFDDDNSRGESGGFSKVLSDKLSTGLARVHREVRLEFRKILGAIEKQLFELLPDQLQRPLEKILGGNPFDSQLDRDVNQTDRGDFGSDIKQRLLRKIRALVEKVQETLRESILGVVNGGHRKFERESWLFVQTMVEQKVNKYLPDVKINVPDDIGNENVSVGAPTSTSPMAGGNHNQGSNESHSNDSHRPDPYSSGPPQTGSYQAPAYSSNTYENASYSRPPHQSQPDYQQPHHSQPYNQQSYQSGPPPTQPSYSGNYQSGQYPPPSHQGNAYPSSNDYYGAPPPGNDYGYGR